MPMYLLCAALGWGYSVLCGRRSASNDAAQREASFRLELNLVRSSLNKTIISILFHGMHCIALAPLYCQTCPALDLRKRRSSCVRPLILPALPLLRLRLATGQQLCNAPSCMWVHKRGVIQPVACLQCLHCDINTVLDVIRMYVSESSRASQNGNARQTLIQSQRR